VTREPDDFEIRARDVLEDQSPELLSKLLALRAETKQILERHWSKARTPSAEELNASNQRMFDRAATLLGPDNFKRIFGLLPNQKIDLVDARLLQKQVSNTLASTHASVSKPIGTPALAGHRMTATTVTLKHLAANVAEKNELSKKQAEAILGGLVGNIVKHLKKGERIRIGGLGILQVRKRAARMGRNPATGEAIQIKASKKVAFRAAKDLKKAI